MADRGRSENFKTDTCTLGFDRYLLKPQQRVVERGPSAGTKFEEWGATLIFPNSTPKTVFEKAIVEAGIDAGWGDEAKIVQLIKDGMIKSPFLKGDSKEARNKDTGELHPGMGPDVWFIRSNTRQAPPVRFKDPNIQATKEDIYSGCKGFAVLNAYTWTGDTGKGVSFGLQYFQRTGDGEKLFTGTGGVDPTAYFEKIDDAGAAPSSTTGGQGAGGLFG